MRYSTLWLKIHPCRCQCPLLRREESHHPAFSCDATSTSAVLCQLPHSLFPLGVRDALTMPRHAALWMLVGGSIVGPFECSH